MDTGYNYQFRKISFQYKINQIKFDNIVGIDLIYANYYSDRMQSDGSYYYTNYKMTKQQLFISIQFL